MDRAGRLQHDVWRLRLLQDGVGRKCWDVGLLHVQWAAHQQSHFLLHLTIGWQLCRWEYIQGYILHEPVDDAEQQLDGVPVC